MKLYELIPAVSKLEEMAEDNEALKEYLDSARLTLNEKVNNIVKFERGLNAGADAIDIEIKRLSELKRSLNKKADNIKEYISIQMQKNGIEKIKTDIAELSFRKSEQVIISDDKEIHPAFILIKEVRSIDKLAIKKAIKTGTDVRGAYIEEFFNLQIK